MTGFEDELSHKKMESESIKKEKTEKLEKLEKEVELAQENNAKLQDQIDAKQSQGFVN